MGNSISPCCLPKMDDESIKLFFWEGPTRIIAARPRKALLAGEIMFEFPDRIVCHAESFYIGRPLPALSLDQELLSGETYFVLPIDRFAFDVLSAASLASLSSNSGSCCPFDYIRGPDGETLIRVLPEFLMKIMSIGGDEKGEEEEASSLCSTPELRKHYAQLVRSRERPWSPNLETISESAKKAGRLSPVRLLGLERRSV
ncbi:hypothetical protein QJS04_geneDACA024554 [Acorus gramineus]|uniref:Uncharacterized protein n=1 Tax=Acorus gramineus TaxID=55184 RepID=A0AAV8ZXN8_ACOGR|nr:hypothetical protein QJS04_geneDACA024554 [Acorus gramineus]